MITIPVNAPTRVKGAWALSSLPIVRSNFSDEVGVSRDTPRALLRWWLEWSAVFLVVLVDMTHLDQTPKARL
jgi:hypothetical protein